METQTTNDKQKASAGLAETTGSANWDATAVANVVANCRQQIERLRMVMPMNVALALGRADEALADAKAWMRAESSQGTYATKRQRQAHSCDLPGCLTCGNPEEDDSPNDPSSATWPTRALDCNRDGPPPFAAAHG